jgi:hypothetical protein
MLQICDAVQVGMVAAVYRRTGGHDRGSQVWQWIAKTRVSICCQTGRVGLADALDAATSQGVCYVSTATYITPKDKSRFPMLTGFWWKISGMGLTTHRTSATSSLDLTTP